MPRVKANGIEIEYEEFGASQDPLIVLIAGFGEQMGSVEFPSDFCQDLSSKGLRVVRFAELFGLPSAIMEDQEG
jgi:alpha-beta hydrolase superfamily lysophospholipase